MRIDEDDFNSEDEREEAIIKKDSEDYFNNKSADISYSNDMVKRPAIASFRPTNVVPQINSFFQIEGQRAIVESEEDQNQRELDQ